MVFSSLPFLFFYLPVVLLIYKLSPLKLRNLFLLLASLFFYGWGEPIYIVIMFLSIVIDYTHGMLVERWRENDKKARMAVASSVFFNLLLLVFFKYYDFLAGSINAVTGLSLPLLGIPLPIGISFYTFQTMSYTIDVYRKDAPVQKNIVTFGAFVTLFPQLIAGPIIQYKSVAEQLESRCEDLEKFINGVQRFCVGAAKKVLLANAIGQLWDLSLASENLTVFGGWLGLIAYAFQIYFDFSGYSDMAIGLGKIFGFQFCENFNYPYLSRSISEFWRRWHMSLGTWFRDYVYIPMGGSRVKRSRWIFNTLTVWMLTGLWHGAAWNFVLWGLLYAAMLLIEKFVPALQKLPDLLRRAYVLLIVMLGFVLFNAADLKQALSDMGGLIGIGGLPLFTRETVYYLSSYAWVFALAIIGATPIVSTTAEKLSADKYTGPVIAALEPLFILVLLIVCTAYLVDGSFNPFLYFRF